MWICRSSPAGPDFWRTPWSWSSWLLGSRKSSRWWWRQQRAQHPGTTTRAAMGKQTVLIKHTYHTHAHKDCFTLSLAGSSSEAAWMPYARKQRMAPIQSSIEKPPKSWQGDIWNSQWTQWRNCSSWINSIQNGNPFHLSTELHPLRGSRWRRESVRTIPEQNLLCSGGGQTLNRCETIIRFQKEYIHWMSVYIVQAKWGEEFKFVTI